MIKTLFPLALSLLIPHIASAESSDPEMFINLINCRPVTRQHEIKEMKIFIPANTQDDCTATVEVPAIYSVKLRVSDTMADGILMMSKLILEPKDSQCFAQMQLIVDSENTLVIDTSRPKIRKDKNGNQFTDYPAKGFKNGEPQKPEMICSVAKR